MSIPVVNRVEKQCISSTIDIDLHSCKSEWLTTWVAELHITQADKDILMNLSAWLSDTIVNAAQIFLKRKVPLIAGLQNVKSCDIQNGEFIQILHTSESDWHVLSTIGTKRPVLCFCSHHTKVQIVNILATKAASNSPSVY